MECGAVGANCRVRAYGTGTSYWEAAEVGETTVRRTGAKRICRKDGGRCAITQWRTEVEGVQTPPPKNSEGPPK